MVHIMDYREERELDWDIESRGSTTDQ